jgi:uncharacterized membrane protein HdeD (DUF308 family)
MASQSLRAQQSWWKLVLTGLLTFTFGVAAVFLSADVMFRRILDVIFRQARPLSASLTGLAALIALLALLAIDGLLNLFGTDVGGVGGKRITRLRGVAGITVAIVAIFWPGVTIFGGRGSNWIVGCPDRHSRTHFCEGVWQRYAKSRSIDLIAGIAVIVIGVAMMRWVFGGAVLVSAVVGVAAAARGVTLIVRGIRERAGLAVNKSARRAA